MSSLVQAIARSSRPARTARASALRTCSVRVSSSRHCRNYTSTHSSPVYSRPTLRQCTTSQGTSKSRTKSLSSPSRTRDFHSTSIARHEGVDRPAPGTGIKVHFKDSKGNLLKTVEANEGDDILSIAHEYDVDLEGACEGSVACSTCHVILDLDTYDKLPEPEDDENDMLDMAFGLTDTSRLGCQVRLTKEMDGMTATLPAATRNMFVDGKKPGHH